MYASDDQLSRAAPPALAADLTRLRDRYLGVFPNGAAQARLLSYVPPAMRHLLSMQLELQRAETLPGHYRDLALAALRNQAVSGDRVDQLVARFAAAMRDGSAADAAALQPPLRRYFTEPQIAELTLALALARAMDLFEAVLL